MGVSVSASHLVILVSFLVCFGFVLGGAYWLYLNYQKKLLLAEVKDWLDKYKKRTTGNNRFIISCEYLQESFPEYDRELVVAVWRDMVAMGWVQEDFIDKQWIVRP